MLLLAFPVIGLSLVVSLFLYNQSRDYNVRWFEDESGLVLPRSAVAGSQATDVGGSRNKTWMHITVAEDDWQSVQSQFPSWAKEWKTGPLPQDFGESFHERGANLVSDVEFSFASLPVFNNNVKYSIVDISKSQSRSAEKLIALDETSRTLWILKWQDKNAE